VIPSFPAGRWRDLKEFLSWDLGHLERAFATGNKGAVLDAVVLCLEHRIIFPEWLGLGVIDAVKGNLDATPAGRRWLRRFRQDMIDFERAEEVLQGREHGLHWSEAYALAAVALRGTRVAGSEDAIQKSYQRFKRNGKRGTYRYRVLNMVHLREAPRSEPQRREFWEYMNVIMANVRASGD